MKFLKNSNIIKKFAKNSQANVAIFFAIISIPLFGAAGAAIDYTRVANAKSDFQDSMDSALLAAANETRQNIAKGDSTTEAIAKGKKVALDFHQINFLANNKSAISEFIPEITIIDEKVRASAKVEGQINNTLMSVLGIDTSMFFVSSVATVPAPRFVELHFVIDNSNSMGIGGTPSDIATMVNSNMSCAFACHIPSGYTVHNNTIDDARALGVQLRIDVVRDVMKDMFSGVQSRNLGQLAKSAIYTMSNSLTTKLEATADFNQLNDALDDITLDNAWGGGGTNFDWTLDRLERTIGVSGDGSSASNPKKAVFVITDGVTTNFTYSQSGTHQSRADPNYRNFAPTIGQQNTPHSIQGFNPNACRDLKRNNNVDVYTINLEYFTPANSQNDSDTRFYDIERLLLDSVDEHLEECASTPENALKANSPDEILEAVNTLVGNAIEGGIILVD